MAVKHKLPRPARPNLPDAPTSFRKRNRPVWGPKATRERHPWFESNRWEVAQQPQLQPTFAPSLFYLGVQVELQLGRTMAIQPP